MAMDPHATLQHSQHQTTVALISTQVKSFYERRLPFRIYHGSTLSTRASARTRENTIDISSLNQVLQIKNNTALVEPNVPMDALVKATMTQDLLPPVVMELPNITVGGGFAGTSGESSSFRYGTFDCTISSVEVVLGNGEVVVAKAGDPESEDLLYGCAGGCGTLGIVTLLELQLIPAKPYVELTYWPVGSVSDAVVKLQEAENDLAVDFLDGILFAQNSGIRPQHEYCSGFC